MSEPESEPPCLVILASPWMHELFVNRGYRGIPIGGIRRLLCAHCLFHMGCKRCAQYLLDEARDPTRRVKRGKQKPHLETEETNEVG